MSVGASNSSDPLRLTINVRRPWISVFLICYTILLWLQDGSIWLTAFTALIVTLDFFTSREELVIQKDRFEWRKKFVWITLSSDGCRYSDLDVIEFLWSLRRIDFVRKGSRPIHVAAGASKSDLRSLREYIQELQPNLASRFRYLNGEDLDYTEQG